MGGVLSFDLAPNICGWCAGAGLDTPTADAFMLNADTEDLGGLAHELDAAVMGLIRQFQPDAISYEAPILVVRYKGRTDKLEDLRRIYGLGVMLEYIAQRESLPCGEIDLRRIKTVTTGNPHAEKKDVANAIERVGITLPKTKAEGRLDAGDAAGGWVVHLSEFDPDAAAPWLAKLRGGLL